MKVKPVASYLAPAYPVIACALAVGATPGISAAAPASGRLLIKGRPAPPPRAAAQMRPCPVVRNTAMISTRDLREALGIPVTPSPYSTSPAWTIGSGARQVTIRAGSQVVQQGRMQIRLSTPPVRSGDGLMLPAEEIGKALGLRVTVQRDKVTLLNEQAHRVLVLRRQSAQPPRTSGVAPTSAPPGPTPLLGKPAIPKPPPLRGEPAAPPAPGK
ncbi:MAG TPA: stalk domain-containing protein [Armatimonadota bacterium]|jgi:hypothetical protein